MANEDTTSNGGITKTSDMLDKYFRVGYDRFMQASDAIELDKLAEEAGIGPVSKQLTADRLKTILAAVAMFSVFRTLKANLLKTILIGGGGYFAIKNRETLKTIFNKEKYLKQMGVSTEPKEDPAMQGWLNRNKAMGDF